ncbi:MAG: cytochrome c family protein, partial [Hyphomicrobiaceae bacterium]
GSGATSPVRLLFVIVPLLVIVAAGTNLVGFWTTSYQQEARKELVRHPQPEREVIAPFDPPRKAAEMVDSQFDAATVLTLLKDASPDDGARLFRMCMPCHAGEKNAPHRIGSNLWGIVGSRKAAHPDYRYSAALKAKGGTWSYRDLAEYLHNPRTFAPGTSMSFAGMTDNRKIADLLVYLRTLSDKPAPLPK